MSEAQAALLIGLVAKLTDVRLSDEMAVSLRRLMFHGYAVLRNTESK